MIFTIKQGNHTFFHLPRLTFKRKISGYFKFITDIPETDYTNKIIGLSDNFHHHKDSVRLGFRGKVACAIFYTNGFRTIIPICEWKEDEKNQFEIKIMNNYYSVKVNDNVVVHERSSNWILMRYRLSFYWGGKSPAPKTVKIEIL